VTFVRLPIFGLNEISTFPSLLVCERMRMILRSLFFVSCLAVCTNFACAEKVASGNEARAVATSAPAPEYPFEARRANITGSGVVVLRVDPATGLVTNAQMAQSTGSPILDDAALSAFRRWRFKPGTIRGARLPITFTMSGASYGPDGSRPILPESLVRSLFAGTSVTGRRLAEPELKSLISYAPMPLGMATASRNWRIKVGVFLLSVRPDGTVSKVEKLQSTGHLALDGEVISWLKKWRFRPNSVTEARVPAYYTWQR
jgi:TonB family protein